MSNSLFPTSSFPEWLKTIAQFNPVSKANEAARLLIANGSLSSSQGWTFTLDIAYLVLFALVLATLGITAAKHALRLR